MHSRCEIVMPPTDNVVEAVEIVMKKFCEHGDEEENFNTRHGFWDFYTIGGRYAGRKLIASFDKTKIDEFYKWLNNECVTVSGLTCGKQELAPESQIPKVDAKWNEMFPSDFNVPCPLFKHSNDQYNKGWGGTLPNDITILPLVPLSMDCGRVIFCRPADEYGPLRAEFMLADTAWNGCNHMPIQWDETFGDALRQYREKIEHMSEAYKAKATPQDNWLVITIDYHS